MPLDKRQTLVDTKFGGRIAEEETDDLTAYFVKTEQWRKLFNGEVDVIYGPKGSGKSALYSLLLKNDDLLQTERRIILIPAENPRGTPAFRDVVNDPPTREEDFRGLWKLYFLTLLTRYTQKQYDPTEKNNEDLNEVIKILEDDGLLPKNKSLSAALTAVLDYLKSRKPSIEGSFSIDPNTGTPIVTGKITLSEPTFEQRKAGLISVDELLYKINSALKEINVIVWLVLDRLDVAFAESLELENNALRSLFRVYLDLIAYPQISLKIFLRDDIWNNLTKEGFREASHITKNLVISRTQQSLLNLIVRRLLYNDAVKQFYNVDAESVLQNVDAQEAFFYRAFPHQVDVGPKQPRTLDWMLSRTADGSERTAPRELIHLLSSARDQQLKVYELGGTVPADEAIFDRVAIKAALPEVSKFRYEATLCAEYPNLKPYLEKLRGEKTQQTIDSLSTLWKTTPDKAIEIADLLIGIGFFIRKGSKESPTFWVPFLYRDALGMIQGAA